MSNIRPTFIRGCKSPNCTGRNWSWCRGDQRRWNTHRADREDSGRGRSSADPTGDVVARRVCQRQRHDIGDHRAILPDRGVLFCVDAIQSLGVVGVDVAAMCIDYLSATVTNGCSARRRRDFLLPTGTAGQNPAADGGLDERRRCSEFRNYDFKLKPDAGRFECGSHPVPGLLALKESLDDPGFDPQDQIAERIRVLGDRVIEGVRRKGYTVISPRTQDAWSGNVCFTSSVHPHDRS